MNWQDNIPLPTDKEYNKFLNNLKAMKTFRLKIVLADQEIKYLICDIIVRTGFDATTKARAKAEVLDIYVTGGGCCGNNAPFETETEQEAEKIFNKFFK